MQTILKQGAGRFTDADLQKLFDELQAVCTLITKLRQPLSPAEPPAPPKTPIDRKRAIT